MPPHRAVALLVCYRSFVIMLTKSGLSVAPIIARRGKNGNNEVNRQIHRLDQISAPGVISKLRIRPYSGSQNKPVAGIIHESDMWLGGDYISCSVLHRCSKSPTVMIVSGEQRRDFV